MSSLYPTTSESPPSVPLAYHSPKFASNSKTSEDNCWVNVPVY